MTIFALMVALQQSLEMIPFPGFAHEHITRVISHLSLDTFIGFLEARTFLHYFCSDCM